MMALVPSPDWFVGLDSLNLCYRGRWKKKLQRDLRPFDAGTDQGRTFTSPKWPNNPQEPISVITSAYPEHPASSFFYPEYKVLPPIAKVEFEMISEYRLRKVHKEVKTPERNSSIHLGTTEKPTQSENPADYGEPTGIQELSPDQERILLESLVFPPASPKQSAPRQLSLYNASPQMSKLTARKTPKRPRFSQTPEMRSLESIHKEQRHRQKVSEYRDYVDCVVSEWTDWSPCSKKCGFGKKHRSRQAIKLPRRGGAVCPLLRESSICGSMRTCKWEHFSMMKNSKAASPFSVFRTRHVRGRGTRRQFKRKE